MFPLDIVYFHRSFIFQTVFSHLMSFHPVRETFHIGVCLCTCVWCVFIGAWCFLWMVCFCLLASQWAKTQDVTGVPQDAARATVAFSFFSITTWVSRTAAVFLFIRNGAGFPSLITCRIKCIIIPFKAIAGLNPSWYNNLPITLNRH